MDGLSKTYIPREVEGPIYERWLAADVFAPDGAGSTADPALPPFTIIQPPPNVTGLAPPRPRPAHDGRGPDGPPRPDARPRGPPAAGPRPRQHRGPVRPRRDHRGGGREPPVARAASATSSGCAPSATRRSRSCSASSGGSAARSTGAGCATRWTTARPPPSGWPSSGSIATASPIAPRRSSTGARVAGPA